MASAPDRIYFIDDSVRLKQSERYICYGTVVYSPPGEVQVDFGQAKWPQLKDIKKLKCPRILLISTWCDGKWGFVGGGGKISETPLECMNREFYEEVGLQGEFVDEEYVYSLKKCTKKVTHLYIKKTKDLEFFTKILTTFHSMSSRKAYVDEVVAITGLPLWIEGPDILGPEKAEDVFGLPRLLVGNAATGMFSSGSFEKQETVTRDHFILSLLISGVVDMALMRRVAYLTDAQTFNNGTKFCLDEFLSMTGVDTIIEKYCSSKECRCMFCGETKVYNSEEEAIRHMEVCTMLQEQLDDSESQFTLPKDLK